MTKAVNIFTSMIIQKRKLPFDVKVSDHPSISFEDAQSKVKKSLKEMTPDSAKPVDTTFQ